MKITKDGFMFGVLNKEDARRIWKESELISLYILYDDDTESLIEDKADLEAAIKSNLDIGVEVGFILKNLKTQKRKKKVKPKKEQKDNIDKEIFTKFETFKLAYKGNKRGLETEYKNFIKKHKDYREVIYLLLPAIEKELRYKEHLRKTNQFVPQMKNLSTWINQRCWEQEFPGFEDKAVEKKKKDVYVYKEGFTIVRGSKEEYDASVKMYGDDVVLQNIEYADKRV